MIELLVTIIVISILAAIAIPVFFRQRDKAFIAQTQSTLANAKLIAEAYYVGNNGSYAGLEEKIENEGLRETADVAVLVADDDDSFCITAVHLRLPEDAEWKSGWVSHESSGPAPGVCSG